MDSMLWGQAWGEGTVALGRPEEKEPDTGWAGAGAGDKDAQARALLRPTASGTEVTGSREPVVTAWGWGGGMCQGEEERPGALGQLGHPSGCQEKTSGQPQSSCIGNWLGRLSPVACCVLTRVLCLVQGPHAAPWAGSGPLGTHRAQ